MTQQQPQLLSLMPPTFPQLLLPQPLPQLLLQQPLQNSSKMSSTRMIQEQLLLLLKHTVCSPLISDSVLSYAGGVEMEPDRTKFFRRSFYERRKTV